MDDSRASRSSQTSHTTDKAPPPVGPYPHAKKVGDFIFVSGMGPRKPGRSEIPGTYTDAEGNVVAHDIEVQTKATIQNIQAVLESMGCELGDVVDVTCFLTDISSDFKRFNKVYAEFFNDAAPTRTTVEVQRLPTPICVELKVIAHVSLS